MFFGYKDYHSHIGECDATFSAHISHGPGACYGHIWPRRPAQNVTHRELKHFSSMLMGEGDGKAMAADDDDQPMVI